jgi:hypothetical protein
MLGGEDEITFIFAIFLIDEDDHFAGAHVGDDVLDGADAHQ